MERSSSIPLSLCLIACLMLPGCRRYACWFSDVFYTGIKRPTYICHVRPYLKSVRMYDGFDTIGAFDALWLHEHVRQAYVDAYWSIRCPDIQRKERALQDEQSVADAYIEFYVLATPERGGLLSDKKNDWQIQLLVNGNCYSPVEIKTIKLSSEYRRFFGPWFTKIKRQYLVRFNAKNSYGTSIITTDTSAISLQFSRLGKQGRIAWCLDGAGNSIPDRSFNKNILAYDIDPNV